jgi:Rieske Fe-S protein
MMTSDGPCDGPSRREAIVGAGILVAGAAVTSCGGQTQPEGPGTTTASTPSPSGTAGGTAGDQPLAAVADVPVGGGLVLPDADVVLTQPRANVFAGFSATCTHQGCRVDQVRDGTIVCPCHGAAYSISDGSVVAGPAPSALPHVAVVSRRGQLFRG